MQEVIGSTPIFSTDKDRSKGGLFYFLIYHPVFPKQKLTIKKLIKKVKPLMGRGLY